ncbi:MAG: hypothetical protein WCV55_02830 [Candidatus Paceibacterota bacterium]
MLLNDLKPLSQALTFEELNHDDLTPRGGPSTDLLLLGKDGDVHYSEFGEAIEQHPIPSAGIRRG